MIAQDQWVVVQATHHSLLTRNSLVPPIDVNNPRTFPPSSSAASSSWSITLFLFISFFTSPSPPADKMPSLPLHIKHGKPDAEAIDACEATTRAERAKNIAFPELYVTPDGYLHHKDPSKFFPNSYKHLVHHNMTVIYNRLCAMRAEIREFNRLIELKWMNEHYIKSWSCAHT